MPIHDWSRVSFGTCHNFHQGWMIALRDALNAGWLPEGYFAMAEQVVGRPEADVVALGMAYVEPVAVGDRLPEMPLLLYGEWHVQTPLEAAYQAAWDVMPQPIRRLFD